MKLHKIIPLLLFLTGTFALQAQYFGKNKPRYDEFNFEVYQTPHFSFYQYLKDNDRLQQIAQETEQWYQLHQEVLQDTFQQKNPFILYNNHADFQQTNAISGAIGVGTGGVTEGLKNRVILPIATSNQQTHHVIGHELVHAFQYHMIIDGDSTSLQSLSNLPLWMVEGLAEYMSIGRTDPHTAMWMRDAVLNDDIPSIKEMDNPKYFPYRYGQAFWAFLTGVYGDDIIEPFFMATAKYGFETAAKKVLNTDSKTLSGMWQSALKTYYTPLLGNGKENFTGTPIISEKNGGRLNISPVVSPDGRYVIFYSEKDLFSLDLYLADARNGEIIRKVASKTREAHIDDFNSIESAGTWSPDGREFAFVAVSKGHDVLIIKDVSNGKTTSEIEIPGVVSFTNPAWSPDGKNILVVGQVDGQSDLFLYNLKSRKVTQITNDKYSEIEPAWSVDGQQIVFASDRLSIGRGRSHGKWTFNLSVYDVNTKAITDLNIFPGADNLNPVYDATGNIYFLSNRDGFRNIYRFEPAVDKVYQLTNFLTGVSGITPYAPAISLARKQEKILFSHYFKNGYTIYSAKIEKLLQEEVALDAVDLSAGTLPVVGLGKKDIVEKNLATLDERPVLADSAFKNVAYQPQFRLDYIGGATGVGVSTGGIGNTAALAGGVDMLFSDILGNHQLYAGLALNGEIYDFGGQVMYINRKNRIAWGASLSHIPYRTGSSYYAGVDTLIANNGDKYLADKFVTDLLRIFEDRAGIFAQFPLSQTRRFEIGSSFSHYGYRLTEYNNYYQSGRFVLQDKQKLDAPPGFNLGNVNAAFVGDNSSFGIASPLQGYRYRLGVEQYFGEWAFTGLTADFRKYQYLKPISLAVRGLHYGRYGKDATNLPPLYIGNPTLVRGYRFGAVGDLDINQMIGSKIFVSNFEVRLPFTGPERLSLIKSKFLLTELALFVDGGVAWDDFSQFGGGADPRLIQPKAVFSTGASMRVNLFGALILEPYYAFPLQKGSKGVFGLNIVPGW